MPCVSNKLCDILNLIIVRRDTMHRAKVVSLIVIIPLLALCVIWPILAEDPGHDARREEAEKLYKEGNYKEAYEAYSKLALDRRNDPKQVGQDMKNVIYCLRNLNRRNEIDAFIEKVIKVHSKNWRLLKAAAEIYFNSTHYGYIIGGEFHRGYHRGGGKYANSFERDRIRGLQLMEQAMKAGKGEKDKDALGRFYLEFARILIGQRGYYEAWRLQYLSDLSKLPDYEEGYYYGYGSRNVGTPVDADGNPVFYKVPKSYEAAQNDGERWRWMLVQAREMSPNLTNQSLYEFANFLHQQFGVQTMAYYGRYFRSRQPDEDKKDESGTYELHTLREDETITRLATGVKRFTLPDEFNFIKIYQQIAENPRTGYGQSSLDKLAEIFENRRQYDKAADYWKRSIKEYGPGYKQKKQKKIDRILGNWGQFEPIMSRPAGKGATVEFRFRNGTEVGFEAHEIDTRQLLEDVKEYLKSNPQKLDWDRVSIERIGYSIIQKEKKKYIGRQVTSWELDLEPRAMHFDKRITVATPLQKPGAYLLTAKMTDGNTSNIVIWLNDTVIVKKPLDKQTYYFVADAVTGKPIPKANVEFFGYRQEYLDKTVFGRNYNVLTANFAEFTDTNGQVILDPKDLPDGYNWLAIARTEGGRFAFLGFAGVWYSNYYDHEYNERKIFVITDRPVYRPKQPVKFKFWVRHAKYDIGDKSTFANRSFAVRINNPKGEKVLEKSFTTDEYGGLDGEYMLPRDATLGIYYIHIVGWGGGNFRVEEYKKPEFEVKIDAPEEPVMLGEKITATITAKYYFGAPVVNAKVKYKVLRYDYSANWYPRGIWDWFYGPGYWWFAYDYDWYPGWRYWGCRRPHWWWWPARHTPPEVVVENEVEIGEDGTVKVEIDTALAKEIHGDMDHKYEITAEVVDQSRRTIVGKGNVLVARRPFKVYAWVNRGHYRVGDVVRANFSAQTLDNKPVEGKGVLKLLKISYDENHQPVESLVQEWDLDTDERGQADIQIKASRAGQYRLSYKLTDSKEHTIEGGYVFVVMGEGFDGKDYRFNEIELVTDKREYAPGEKVKLMINTDRVGSTVVLFVRPANGIYLPPKIIRMEGKSTLEEISITKKDMPNFFVEALTISDGKIYSETREIIVPPEKRVLNVEIIRSAESYKPGEKAKVKVKLTDFFGEPFVGSVVMSIYDKSVEYISGGSNVPEIKAFFWKWRRRHYPRTESNLQRYFYNLVPHGSIAMSSLGVFGHLIADVEWAITGDISLVEKKNGRSYPGMGLPRAGAKELAESSIMDAAEEGFALRKGKASGAAGEAPAVVEPTVRKKFADTAFWAASLTTDQSGMVEVELDMPENLTGWKIKTWAMGHGTKVGEGNAEVVTAKDLLLRLQAPRFFVEKDEVVLSANIHNYLKTAKSVTAILELDGGCLEFMDKPERKISIDAGGEKRVDWRVKVVREGEAIVRMKALTDEESDAMEMSFPVYVHGMLKTDSFSGVLRPEQKKASITINVPKERRIDQSRLEVRYSPTLAGAMVDALPYMVEYPYGCTEQTLNRFLPTVITQKILMEMGLDLKDIQDKRTNLNAQEIDDDVERAKQWKRWKRNPVFDKETVEDMVKQGVKRLTSMQNSDGGWGWFSGWDEHSYSHMTAYVVHGLQIALENDVAIVPGVLENGVKWLENYQAGQVIRLKNAETETEPWKRSADNIDAFVYMVLADAKIEDKDMREFLYRDRNNLAVYAKAMFGMALHKQQHTDKRDMLIRNIEQYLVEDDENQTAYLNLPNSGYWWYWYGSEYEAHAYYLKLLARVNPRSEKASRLVKYLLNNRKHATYWNSTRDTSICIEAFADYLRATDEHKPDLTVEIYVDGKKHKEVRITSENLFTFDNSFVLEGGAVESGRHKIEFRKKGAGPLYFNAYVTNFTLEDFITKAGLEVKVNRKYYKLVAVDKKIKTVGSHGQAVDKKVEKYERVELKNLSTLKSGDLVEIELVIDSKNDYEYIMVEDMKAAGFEPVEVRSGYGGNEMGAYMELRDERVAFFVRWLARGKHSVSYRMRAEIPGRFSALPTKISAMYAPELKGNSDEIKLRIED